MMRALMAITPIVSFVFLFAVVFQIVKFRSALFFWLLVILSPFLALTCYQALSGLASGSTLWVMFIVLVVVVILLVKNRLRG
jgi:hypothetical protein